MRKLSYATQSKQPRFTLSARFCGVTGTVLLALSLPVLILMILELWASQYAYSAYQIEPVFDFKMPITFGSHRINIQPSTKVASDDMPFFPYRITIDEADLTLPDVAGTGCTLMQTQPNRVGAAILADQKLQSKRLTITQGLSAWPRDLYRIISVHPDGSITQEVFTSAERQSPMYRVMLMSLSARVTMGFYSEVLNGWPSCIYPIFYPFATGLLGVVFTSMGIVKWRRCQRPVQKL